MNASEERAISDSEKGSASPGEAWRKVTRVAMHLTRASGSALALEVAPGRVECVAACGAAPATGSVLEAESGISGLCLRTGEFQVVRDADTDARVEANTCRELGVRSLLLVPVRREERVVGVLSVYSPELQKFSADDSATMEQLRLLADLASESEPLAAVKAESLGAGSAQPTEAVLLKEEVEGAPVSVSDTALDGDHAEEPAAASAGAEIPFHFGAAEPERRVRVPAAARMLLALGLILVAWSERGQWARLHLNRVEAGQRSAAKSATAPVPPASAPVLPAAAVAESAASLPSDNPPSSPAATAPADLATVGAARYSLEGGVARALIDVDREVYYRGSRLESPARAYFDLRGARLANRKQETLAVGEGGLLRVRISQYDGQTVRIVLDLAGAYDCSARFATNPSRLEIAVMPRGIGR